MAFSKIAVANSQLAVGRHGGRRKRLALARKLFLQVRNRLASSGKQEIQGLALLLGAVLPEGYEPGMECEVGNKRIDFLRSGVYPVLARLLDEPIQLLDRVVSLFALCR